MILQRMVLDRCYRRWMAFEFAAIGKSDYLPILMLTAKVT